MFKCLPRVGAVLPGVMLLVACPPDRGDTDEFVDTDTVVDSDEVSDTDTTDTDITDTDDPSDTDVVDTDVPVDTDTDVVHTDVPVDTDLEGCAVDPTICDLNADCLTGADGSACVCGPGYEGDGATCADRDDCGPNACGIGDCIDAAAPSSGFQCACPFATAWDGSACAPTTDEPFAGVPRWVPGARLIAFGLADLDHDGFQDLIGGIADPNVGHRLGHRLGDGRGGFADFVSVDIIGEPQGLTLADFDGDGHDDVALAYDAQSEVFFGDGSAGMVSGAYFWSEPDQYGMELLAGDLDGDGDADLVSAGRVTQRQTAVFGRLGDGAGGFAQPVSGWYRDVYGRDFVLGEFDGDGTLDIAMSESSSSTSAARVVQVYSGDGAGGFSYLDYAIAGDVVGVVAACDLDGDGVDELIAGDAGGYAFSVISADPVTGVFGAEVIDAEGAPQGMMRCEDLDGDGDPDVLATSIDDRTTQLEVLRNDNGALSWAGAFEAWRASASPDPTELALGDVNGDGWADALVGLDRARALVQLGDGQGRFASGAVQLSAPHYFGDAVTADFDLDGVLDVAASLVTSNQVLSYRGLGGRRFDDAIATVVPAAPTFRDGPSWLAVGDFDGDGFPDLAVAVAVTRQIEVLLGDGIGGFVRGTPVGFGAAPLGGLTAADVDGDGRVDLAALLDGTLTLYAGDGLGGFGAGRALGQSGYQASGEIVVDDLDDDGFSDVVVSGGHSAGWGLRVVFGDASDAFTRTANLSAGGQPVHAFQRGDFDGDGRLDLLTLGRDGGDPPVLALLRGDGAGGFALRTLPFPSWGSTSGLQVADLDADGNLDAVADGLLLYGDGAGAFSVGPHLTLGGPQTELVDLDGDGRVDQVVTVQAFGVALAYQ